MSDRMTRHPANDRCVKTVRKKISQMLKGSAAKQNPDFTCPLCGDCVVTLQRAEDFLANQRHWHAGEMLDRGCDGARNLAGATQARDRAGYAEVKRSAGTSR